MDGAGTPDTRAVALYWDFENLHASLCEAKATTEAKPQAQPA